MIRVDLTITTVYTKLNDGMSGVHKYCILGRKNKKQVKEMFLKIYDGNGIEQCQVVELENKKDNITLSSDDMERSMSDIISSYCQDSYNTESMLLWFIMFQVKHFK